jgi:deoxyribodipyrimidine photolyase-related protein
VSGGPSLSDAQEPIPQEKSRIVSYLILIPYTTSADFETPLKAGIIAHKIAEVRVMAANEIPCLQLIQNLQLPREITLIPNNQFPWTATELKNW